MDSQDKNYSSKHGPDDTFGTMLSRELSREADGPCLDSEEIAAIVEGTAGAEDKDRILKHISSCEYCYDIFLLASQMENENQIGSEVELCIEDEVQKQSEEITEKKTTPGKFIPFKSMALAASILIAIVSIYIFYTSDDIAKSPEAMFEKSTAPAQDSRPSPVIPKTKKNEENEMILSETDTDEKLPETNAGIGKDKGKFQEQQSPSPVVDGEKLEKPPYELEQEKKFEKKVMNFKKTAPKQDGKKRELIRKKSNIEKDKVPSDAQLKEKRKSSTWGDEVPQQQKSVSNIKSSGEPIGKSIGGLDVEGTGLEQKEDTSRDVVPQESAKRSKRMSPGIAVEEKKKGTLPMQQSVSKKEMPVIQQVEAQNMMVQRFDKYIPAGDLEFIFENTVRYTRQLDSDYYSARSTGKSLVRDRQAADMKVRSFEKKILPTIKAEASRGTGALVPNIPWFRAKSTPGSLEHRFFTLAASIWCDENGNCYGKVDAQQVEKLLPQWRDLYPQLTGVFKRIAGHTISHMEKN